MRAANFVEETTTSIAGTSGNGAVTLTAIASTPRFSTVFGTQATTIRYVIEDTVAKTFEVGIGSVASNVLTRTRPQITWTGSVYDDSTPSPLAFGSTPTSGNIKIRIAATAESQGAGFGSVQSIVAVDYPFSSHVCRSANNGTAVGVTAGTEYYCPYQLNRSGLLTGAQFFVSTAVAASNFKAALYSCGPSGIPDRKIVDFNILDSASTGQKTDTTTGTWTPAGPVWLTPGWYFVGFIPSGAIGLRGFITGDAVLAVSPLGRKDGYGEGTYLSVAGNYATGLPAAPNLSGAVLGGGFQGFFHIGLKVDA